MSKENKNGTKKSKKWVLLIILIVLLTPIIVVLVILYSRLATIASVEHVDQDLYKITIKQDYFLDDVLEANISDYEELNAFIDEKMYLGLADYAAEEKDFGCSSFLAKTPEGDYIAGRNYDYSDSDELIFYTNPSDGFASIGMTELRAMGVGEQFGIAPDSFLGKATMLSAPYCTMDGVNEKGVMVSILQLTSGGIHQDKGKPDIDLWVAIRLILDRAESVDHAISLLNQYDIHDTGYYAHHLFISDSTGNAVVVEWNGNEMKVVKNQPSVTNFTLSVGSKTLYSGRCPRFDKITEWLTSHTTTTPEQAMDVLKSISQSSGGYPTQWSAVYNLNQCSMDITLDRNYDKVYHFTAKDFK